MKKFTSLFTLICALFITTATAQVNQTVVFDFVNNAWGIPTYEATNLSGVKSQTVYNDGENSITINPTANKGNFYYEVDCLRLQNIGSKIILPAFDFAVEKIEVVGSSKASSYQNADINIFTAGKAVSTPVAGLTESHTFEIAQEDQATGNVYEIVIGSGGGKYSSVIYISYIKVYPAASDDALTIVDPVFDNGTGVYIGSVEVKVSSPTENTEGVENVTYHYTTDGTLPNDTTAIAENGTITISESCTLKVVLKFTYEGETYISESTVADYIISEEVIYPKATVMASGVYFIAANNAIALPYNNGVLPTQPTSVDGDNISDAEYYSYNFENDGNGGFYIRDVNGLYLTASAISTKDEIKTSTTYHNSAWNVIIENGIAKIQKDGFVLAYNNNAIVAVREEKTNATTIYPSLYGIADAPSVFSYTPDPYTTELKTINITFSEAVRVEGITSTDQFPIYNVEDDAYPVGMGNWTHSGKVMTIELENAITTNGDYYIKIPAECITSEITGKKPEEDLIINLVIYNEDQTSIKNIDCDNNNIAIYDLNGRRVEKITNAGIYIVNGKKVLVK